MNVFKDLDLLFPCGDARFSGEVVSMSLYLTFEDSSSCIHDTWLSGKRKSWYVNASVNAWHLHRQLCQDLKDSDMAYLLNDLATVRKLFRHLVMSCYHENWDSDTQYFTFAVAISNTDSGTSAVATRRVPSEPI